MDFNQRPFIVIWEPTRACDLSCVHCRAEAQPLRNPLELSTYEGYKLIDQVVALGPRIFVLTGGDPLKRPDIFEFIDYARRRGLEPSLTPSATPLLTREAIVKLKSSGLTRLAVSLDGSSAEVHDSIRRVSGSFDITINAIRAARQNDIPVQINSTVSRKNLADLDNLIALLETLDIAMLSVFFLVPTGRGQTSDMITATEVEKVFAKLYATSRRVSFDVKTTEAMHYRRFILQRKLWEMGASLDSFLVDGKIDARLFAQFAASSRRRGPIGVSTSAASGAPSGVNDAKGFIFVSHTGDVCPSGFLPRVAGNIRVTPLAELYRTAPLFQMLRDTSQLKGKCGVCEFREICGGSRARANALTGDPMEEESLCIYVPKAMRAAS